VHFPANSKQAMESNSLVESSHAPATILVKVMVAILGVEFAIMALIEWVFVPSFGANFPLWFWEFIDPFLLILILSPILYYWIFLPMKDAQTQIRELAYYDTLTKLPNRRLLEDRITQAMAMSKRKGCFGALIALDLDNFKPINDTHGHAVGDLLLVEVARRLTTCVRANDTVSRFGGDEFVVVLSDLSADRQEAVKQAGGVAEKIRSTLAASYSLNVAHQGIPEVAINHQCSASIGVALFFQRDPDNTDLLKQADAAMYQAKDAGRNSIRFFQQVQQG
jgi:diguanylate cyclase (GGDEF)-like protein